MLREISFFGLFGLVLGVVPGMIAASAYATWLTGGDLTGIDPFTILAFSPLETGSWGEPFQTSALIGAGVVLTFALAAVALGVKPKLTSHGSAKWADERELKRANMLTSAEATNGPLFAKLGGPSSRQPFVTSLAHPHSLIAAPTGSGKGVGIVIPTLLTYVGSTIVLDVKGENFEKTARQRRQMGDRIFKFAPYDEEGRTHRYNPLDEVLRAQPNRRYTAARRLAAALIIAKSKGAEGFLESAREIFAAGVILAIERDRPTIAEVYDLLAQDGHAFEMFETLAEEARSPEAKKIFTRMAGQDGRILSSYLSVLADGGLALWNDPAVRDATALSDFDLSDLRRDPASIYIVVSPNDLVPLSPLVRLLFQQAVAVLQRREPTKDEKFPVLFLLDEFVSLGRMDALGTGITTLRSYGGRIMIIAQSLASLRDLYGADGASNFLANCGVQLYMAPADGETPEYISRAIGEYTRKSRTKSWNMNELTGANIQERQEGARLIRPEELRNLSTDELVMLVQNQNPVRTRKIRYYEDRSLKPIFEGQKGDLPLPPALEAPKPRIPLCEADRTVQPSVARYAELLGSALADRTLPAENPLRSPGGNDEHSSTEQIELEKMDRHVSDLLGKLQATREKLNSQGPVKKD